MGNAVNIENALPPKTKVPIVLDEGGLDDVLKYDNNANDLYANNVCIIFVMTYEIASATRF